MNKKRGRICFISGVISRSGGTERVGSIIANSLSQKGYDIYILSYWNHGKPYFPLDEKIHVHYLLDPKKEGKLYRTYIYPVLKLRHFIMKNKLDIVIDIDTELARYSAIAIHGTRCKLISWEHFNYWTMLKLGERKRFIAKRLIKKFASKLVVLTDEDRLKHIEVYNLPEKKVCTMPNPCVSNVNSDYNFDNHIFLAVGRLTQEKGYDLLLQAWSEFERNGTDWKLIIVGKGEQGEELKELCKLLQLKNVEFAGHSDHVENYYKTASCFVLSSRFEGFPMVIIEAQSFALPVIAFDCKTGPRELIKDGYNGYLVEDGDIHTLSNCMCDFVKNRDKAFQMSKKARHTVSEFNLDKIIVRWIDLINEVLVGRGD